MNECLNNRAGCSHICNDIYASYYCSCRPGYRILNTPYSCPLRFGRKKREVLSVFEHGDATEIEHHRVKRQTANDNLYCRETPEGTICFCLNDNPIVPVNGTQCVDINECNVNNGGCESQCFNTEGSFQCGCGTGFRLTRNNRNCEDINECREQPGICQGRGGCVDTWGGYYCINDVARAKPLTAAVPASVGVGAAGTVAAIALSAVNVIILVGVAIKCARDRRQAKSSDAGEAPVVKGQSNSAFRAESGTIRSFNSLNSKFGASLGSVSEADSESIHSMES